MSYELMTKEDLIKKVNELHQANLSLEADYRWLFDNVRKMRGRQIEFLKYRSSQDRKDARRLELVIDHFITDTIKKSKQGQLELKANG